MEKKKEVKQNKNGVYETTETIETTLQDGFIAESNINPVNMNNYGKYHKGYSKSKVFSTNDPSITRPFAYGISGLIFGIGIMMLFINLLKFDITLLVLGLSFILTSVFAFIKSKNDIDKIEKKIRKEKNVSSSISSAEVQKAKEFISTELKEGFNEVATSAFTKKNFNKFKKSTLPIYCVITIVLFLIFTFLINIFFGLFIFGICVITGVIYYYIFSKIFKY